MRTIEITTSQKVTIEYHLASLRDRFFAFFIDSVIIWGGITALTVLYGMSFSNAGFQYFIWFVILPVFFLYTPTSEFFMSGRTWGKKALGLKVVRLNGRSPGLTDYGIRWAFRLIDIWFSIGSIGALLISSSQKSQRLGGQLSNTVVIRTKSRLQLRIHDLMNINSRKDYDVQYRNVVKFSEEDMLFIKSTIDRVAKYPNKSHKEALNELVKKAMEVLGGNVPTPQNKVGFLNTLINDYIVLTR